MVSRGNPGFRVPLFAHPRRFRESDLKLIHPFPGDPVGWAVGVGIHTVRAGEDALEIGAAVRKGLARLVRDALRGFGVASLNLLGGGDGVTLHAPYHYERILGRTACRSANLLQLFGATRVVGPGVGIEEDRRLIEGGDDSNATCQLVCEGPPWLAGSPNSAAQAGKPDGANTVGALAQFHALTHLLGFDEVFPVVSLQGLEAEIGNQCRDVDVLHRDVGCLPEAAGVQLVS